jgi:hypothetical protein
MHRLPIVLVVSAIVAATATSKASAQDYPGVVRLDDPAFSQGSYPTTGRHSGLLGKMYLQGRYLHFQTDNSVVSPFDDTVQGFDVFFNAPIPWFHTVAPGLGVDAFLNYAQVGIDGSNSGVTVDADVQLYRTGVTLYAEFYGPVRPFVQLGVDHGFSNLTISDGMTSVRVRDSNADLMLNVGVEADINQMVSTRLMLEIDTDDFNTSPFTADLILWPDPRFFLRGGLFVTLDGNEIGGQVGAGFVF